MSAILNSLNVHNFLIFQPILMTLVSKLMVYTALSVKTYILLGLRSPLSCICNMALYCYVQCSRHGIPLHCVVTKKQNQYEYTTNATCNLSCIK